MSKELSIENCAFVKTILMLCVIIGHCVNFWNGTWFTVIQPANSAYPLEVLSLFVNSFHTYAFTMVSGFLFCYLINEEGKYKKYFLFIFNKIRRLIIPYIFVSAIWVVPIGIYFNHYNLKEVFERYILGTNPNQLWFLLMLFWVFVIAWPMKFLFQKNILISGILVMVFYAVGAIGNHLVTNYFCIWTACEYLLFFWIGFEVYNNYTIFKKISWHLWSVTYVIVFFMSFMTRELGTFYSINQVVLHILGAIAAFSMLQFVATKVRWKNNFMYIFLSRKTMPVFLFHQQVIYFILVWLNGKINPYIIAMLNFIIASCISLAISSLLMKNKVTKILIGEK